MRNFKVRWSEGGRRRVSVVSYSETCAAEEADAKRARGFADAEVFEVRPGTDRETG